MKLRRSLLLPLAALAFGAATASAAPTTVATPRGPVTFDACLGTTCAGRATIRTDAVERDGAAFSMTVTVPCTLGRYTVIADPVAIQLYLPSGVRFPDRFAGACNGAYEPGMTDTVILMGTLSAWSTKQLRQPWVLTVDGQAVARGLLNVRRLRQMPGKAYTIRDTSFDDYVNVCLDGDHRVWASGGHLQCTLSIPTVRWIRYSLEQLPA